MRALRTRHKRKTIHYASEAFSMYSKSLGRNKRVEVYLPPCYHQGLRKVYPVIYMNDGQDALRLRLQEILHQVHHSGQTEPFVLVAVHANDRVNEYGTAARPDYAGRGYKAGRYTKFVLGELMPLIRRRYRVSELPARTAFMGFSLGGLTAFDIVWHHPHRFSKVGAFSASFWWRSRKFDENYIEDTDRIMHQLIRQSHHKPGLRFWLQAATKDETDDRNANGIIDAIEDTFDIISELTAKGYLPGPDIRYVEVQGGYHDPATWAKVMPDFFRWAFGVSAPPPRIQAKEWQQGVFF